MTTLWLVYHSVLLDQCQLKPKEKRKFIKERENVDKDLLPALLHLKWNQGGARGRRGRKVIYLYIYVCVCILKTFSNLWQQMPPEFWSSDMNAVREVWVRCQHGFELSRKQKSGI